MFVFLLTSLSFAVPLQFNHQGRLLDVDGEAVAGEHQLTFRIYDTSSGGTIQWEEVLPVNFIDGYYSVWMKNTFISLDVLFLDSQYKIIDYVENTIPHNLDSISINKKSRYIVELNSGTVKRMNLKKGKKLNFKIIKNLS